jgi:hypothetical protein
MLWDLEVRIINIDAVALGSNDKNKFENIMVNYCNANTTGVDIWEMKLILDEVIYCSFRKMARL